MVDHLNDEGFFLSLSAGTYPGALDAEYGDGRYGDVAGDLARTLGGLLGTASSSAAGPILRDPEVQQTIAEATQECKTRAKEGVGEWFNEEIAWGLTPKHWTLLGVGTLIIGHWMGTTLALALAFPRSAYKDVRKAAGL